jgi:hypothetical protein
LDLKIDWFKKMEKEELNEDISEKDEEEKLKDEKTEEKTINLIKLEDDQIILTEDMKDIPIEKIKEIKKIEYVSEKELYKGADDFDIEIVNSKTKNIILQLMSQIR